MFDFYIRKKEDLVAAVNEFGFVPLFANAVPGFSVEEHVHPDAWFSGEEGVWEWKGPVIREAHCAYGKFFDKKAVFISEEWFPDFANYRRDGYDFDARYEDGLAAYRDKELYELLDREAPAISKALKAAGNYKKGGRTGFDTVMTRLQSQCYVVISDFVYAIDKAGKEYGWGLAEYSTPELFFGQSFRERVYQREPEESYQRILEHLKKLLPVADETAIRKLLG